MIEKIFETVTGIVAFAGVYYIEKELEEYYYEKDALRLLNSGRLLPLVALHILVSPWAYFKLWKVKSGYFLAVAEVFLISLGFYSLYMIFN